MTPDELHRAYGVHPIAAPQTEWSMWRPVDPVFPEAQAYADAVSRRAHYDFTVRGEEPQYA